MVETNSLGLTVTLRSSHTEQEGGSNVSTRAEDLATKVEQSLKDLLAAVEASTPEQCAARCSDGEWTQGFSAYHAAMNIGPITQTVKGVADGQPFPGMSMESIDADNAVQATEHAGCTVSETVDLLKDSAPAAVSMVRSLRRSA